ncbi:MAG: hypothetical protein C4530_15415 [Desulfobacteraceae bacterium]|nr:MAG: hypothetical protein C4530_15415 [Desulfobacteraceae bacterium]
MAEHNFKVLTNPVNAHQRAADFILFFIHSYLLFWIWMYLQGLLQKSRHTIFEPSLYGRL